MPEIRHNANTGPGVRTLCEGPWSPGRCSPAQHRGPGRHHVTATKKLSKEVNVVAMECYYRSNSIDENSVPLKEYRQRMYRE